MTRFHKTRKAAAAQVKDLVLADGRQRFIYTRYRAGAARPVWEVSELTPIGASTERFYGPFTSRNVRAKTEQLGVEWSSILPNWVGAPIRGYYN